MKHDAGVREFRDVAGRLGVDLPPGRAEALLRFEALLRDSAAPYGLVATGDVARIRERHLLDCLRAAAVVEARDTTAFDLGSGAGLPGIVVAIAVPQLVVTLVESRRRRVAFLELAIQELHLGNAIVVQGRIEHVSGQADLAFARALAPLPESWALGRPLLRPGGRLVYFAGERSQIPEVPGASRVEVRSPTVLESGGPLVIMAR